MEKKFFDWADDPELNGTSKVVQMPLTGEEKLNQELKDLESGYEYGKTGLLQKKQNLNVEPDIIYYDPKDLKMDDKGRTYFVNQDGYPTYITSDGRVYHLRVSQVGEEEFTVFRGGTILVFKDPEHTIGVTNRGDVYQYDSSTDTYVYSPQIVLFSGKQR